MEEAGGWLWVIIDIVAVAILAGGLIYGTMMWRNRRMDPETKRRQAEVTREHFEKGE